MTPTGSLPEAGVPPPRRRLREGFPGWAAGRSHGEREISAQGQGHDSIRPLGTLGSLVSTKRNEQKPRVTARRRDMSPLSNRIALQGSRQLHGWQTHHMLLQEGITRSLQHELDSDKPKGSSCHLGYCKTADDIFKSQ